MCAKRKNFPACASTHLHGRGHGLLAAALHHPERVPGGAGGSSSSKWSNPWLKPVCSRSTYDETNPPVAYPAPSARAGGSAAPALHGEPDVVAHAVLERQLAREDGRVRRERLRRVRVGVLEDHAVGGKAIDLRRRDARVPYAGSRSARSVSIEMNTIGPPATAVPPSHGRATSSHTPTASSAIAATIIAGERFISMEVLQLSLSRHRGPASPQLSRCVHAERAENAEDRNVGSADSSGTHACDSPRPYLVVTIHARPTVFCSAGSAVRPWDSVTAASDAKRASMDTVGTASRRR
jgi:hypothetical protein